jgi:CrcB protein
MTNLIWIGLGGAAGAIARYAMTEWTQRILGPGFAWGTLCVNLLGCFLIGLAFHVIAAAGALPHYVRFLVVVGFLGAFTTFSTFSLENVNFVRDGKISAACLYVAVSNAAGIALCFAGLRLGHWLHPLVK